MKIGCLLKFAALIVIILGISFYIVKKYGSDIVESSKEKMEVFIAEKIQNSIDEMSESAVKDSLQKNLDDFIEEIDLEDIQISSKEYNLMIKKFTEFMDSNEINQESLKQLKNLIKEYERP